MRVLDKAGEILDRETRTIQPAAEAPLALAPVVYVARTPAEARALSAPDAPVHAGREFVRTDRLVIRLRTYGTSAAAAEVTGRLIDRRGATLIPLAIAGSSNGWHQLDLPRAIRSSSRAPFVCRTAVRVQQGCLGILTSVGVVASGFSRKRRR